MTTTITIDITAPVADLVSSNPECARVLKDAGIDYCCQGQQTLTAACAARGLDLAAVTADLLHAVQERAGAPIEHDPRDLSISALIARIIERHHRWLRDALPWLRDLSDKVGRVHGGHDPRLVEVAEVTSQLAAALLPHLDEEEEELFPALMARGTPREVIEAGLSAMEGEHRQVGAMLERLRALTDGYTPPEWACASYGTLLEELDHLEEDVLRHVHLENHVLAAKARARLQA